MRMPGRTAGRLRRNGPIQPSPRRRSCADPGRALGHSNRAPPRVDHAIAPRGSVADARRPYDFWVADAVASGPGGSGTNAIVGRGALFCVWRPLWA